MFKLELPHPKWTQAPFLLSLAFLLAWAQPASARNCPALGKLQLPQARVALAEAEASGTFTPVHGPAIEGLPPFCRVVVQAEPSIHSKIQIEVWLPLHAWNRRLVGVGSGGFGGIIEYAQLGETLRDGYVASTSDMGTSPASALQADALIGQPERWKDFGWRATHLMTVIAKRLTVAFYGTGAEFSYFRGCSTGGQQGLSEAQRFPSDYDGIVSGAPAYARTRLHAAILWNHRELSRAVDAGLTPSGLSLLSAAVLKTCGTHPAQGPPVQVADPAACAFHPEVLLCTGHEEKDCLNSQAIDAVLRLIAGPKDSHGQSIYPGLEWGSEADWSLPPAHPRADEVPFASIFRWVWGASWQSTNFNFDTDVAAMDRRLGPFLNATDPNLSNFQRMGHKLLLYHGWADPLVPPRGTINYFRLLRGAAPGAPHSDEVFARLFMIPGMAHCGDGTGPSHLDLLPALRAWVEAGIVPETITGTGIDRGTGTQAFHPYPEQAEGIKPAGQSTSKSR